MLELFEAMTSHLCHFCRSIPAFVEPIATMDQEVQAASNELAVVQAALAALQPTEVRSHAAKPRCPSLELRKLFRSKAYL
jgi:hypothetical protein